MDVATWLRAQGFETLIDAFARERIDARALHHLDADDLKELGVATLGERKRLLAAIAALRAGAQAAPPPQPAAVPSPAGERREVSVVFADLCGFTALSARLGAEPTHALLRRLFERLDAAVLRYGGTVDKHIGDAVMAAFGATRAHGDDPERAVRAALAMVEATAALGRESGEELALHAGVASGTVVSASTAAHPGARAELTGEAVNLAARLTDRAPAGSVLICATTHRACGDSFATAPAGPFALKGFAAPVACWRAIAPRVEPAPAEDEASLVGRASELAQFDAAVVGLRARGRAVVLVLRGEAGIGKSRLAAAFEARAAAAGIVAHRGRFADFGDTAQRDGLRMLARSLLGIAFDARAADAASRADAAAADPQQALALRELADLPPEPAHAAVLAAMDAAARREAACEALLHLLRAQAARAPLMLVVEDLHWAPADALELLAALLARGATLPLLAVLTTRPEGDPLDAAWRARLGATPLLAIELGPLQQEEAQALAARHAGLDQARVAHCIARAGGHPLFLEQLLRHAGDERPAPLPGSLLSIVLARMDALAEADRAALQAAAVLGQALDIEALRHLIARDGYAPEPLIAAGLLRPEAGRLAFVHALIRDGAYAALLDAPRRALHRRAAEWYAGRDPALHAEHLARAGAAEAPEAFLAAARVARDRRRLDEAVRLARAGLESASDAARRHPLARLLGDALRDLGDSAGSLAACLTAVESAGDDEARAEALIAVAETMRIADRLDDAFACLDAAEKLATGAGRTDLLARAAHLRGNLHFPRGESAQCLAAHARAHELAVRAGAPELVALSQGGLGDAAYALGRLRSAAAHFGRCIEVARTHRLMRIEAANAPMLAFTRLLQRPPESDDADAERAIALAHEIGHLRAGVIAHHAVVLPALWRLDLERAERHVQAAIALAERAGAARFEGENLAFLADVRRLQGGRAEALELLARAVASARRTGIRYFGPIILGSLALATQDAAQRAAAIAEGESLLGAGALAHNRLFFRAPAIDAAVEDGDVAAIRRHADALAEAFAEEPIALADFLVTRARALADALERPDSQDARATLAHVLEDARSEGWRAFLPAIERVLARS